MGPKNGTPKPYATRLIISGYGIAYASAFRKCRLFVGGWLFARPSCSSIGVSFATIRVVFEFLRLLTDCGVRPSVTSAAPERARRRSVGSDVMKLTVIFAAAGWGPK